MSTIIEKVYIHKVTCIDIPDQDYDKLTPEEKAQYDEMDVIWPSTP